MFQLYKRNKQTAYLMQQLDIAETDYHMLWVIDMIESAFLPYGFWVDQEGDALCYVSAEGTRYLEHPAISYYSLLLARIRATAKQFYRSSLYHRLTCNPPEVIKDMFNVFYYYQIAVDAEMHRFAWIPMVYLSTGTSNDYVYDEHAEAFFNKHTGDICYISPDDALFSGFVERQIQNDGSCVVPRLTKEESALLPNSTMLLYDFSTLSVHLLYYKQLRGIQNVRIPHIQLQYAKHMNVYAGILRASELVFDARAAETPANLEVPSSTSPMLTSNSVSFLNYDPHLSEIDDRLMQSRMSELYQQRMTYRQQNCLYRYILAMDYKLKDTLDSSSVNYQIREKKLSFEVLVKRYRGELPCSIARQLGKSDVYERIYFYKTDVLIQGLFNRPPDSTQFESYLLLTEELARQIHVAKTTESVLTAKVDEIVLHWFHQRNRPVKHLKLEVRIEYVQESEPAAQTCAEEPELVQRSNNSSLLTLGSLELQQSRAQSTINRLASGKTSREYVYHQKNHLTYSIIKYRINGIPVQALALPEILNYKPTIIDFAIGTLVQFGPYAFVIQQMDSQTKLWYEQQLRMLRVMRNNLEVELIRAGQIAFCYRFSRVSDEQVKNCTIKMRRAVEDVIQMYNFLATIKDNISLEMFKEQRT